MRIWTFLPALLICTLAHGQPEYVAPKASSGTVDGVSFGTRSVGAKFASRFAECDTKNTCDGKPLKYGCSKDRSSNTALLRLQNDTLFFDAKMGLDADGSPYSRKSGGQTDQPETSLRYPLPGRPSINADRVPFVVIPLGGFGAELGVSVGDVAAVVYRDKIVFAAIADEGPPCKIGEGSIQLHELLGHTVCQERSSAGDCVKLRDVGVEKDVLYFLFPGTRKDLYAGLTPDNINERIQSIGAKAWEGLRAK